MYCLLLSLDHIFVKQSDPYVSICGIKLTCSKISVVFVPSLKLVLVVEFFICLESRECNSCVCIVIVKYRKRVERLFWKAKTHVESTPKT